MIIPLKRGNSEYINYKTPWTILVLYRTLFKVFHSIVNNKCYVS